MECRKHTCRREVAAGNLSEVEDSIADVRGVAAGRNMLGSRRRKRMGSSKVRRRTLWELRRQAVSSKKTNNAPPVAA